MGCGASQTTPATTANSPPAATTANSPPAATTANSPPAATTANSPPGRRGRGKGRLEGPSNQPAERVRRLVLYASNTPDKQDFDAMVKCEKREYDFATATKDDLIRLMQDAAGGQLFNSIALATHGDNEKPGFEWEISKKLVVTGGDLNPDVTALMRAMGDATTSNGRIDLLACSLLNEEKGRMAFEAIEETSDAHFAASSDITGNAKSGGDWVMESDGVNIKSLYFDDTCNFEGTFDSHTVPVIFPVEAHHIKKGAYIMLKGSKPCKIVDVKTSKTGKHGHAKCNITGIDVLDGRKYNEVHPGHIVLAGFEVLKVEYEVTGIDDRDNICEAMDEEGNQFSIDLQPDSNEVWGTVHQHLIAAHAKCLKEADGGYCVVTVVTTPVCEWRQSCGRSGVEALRDLCKLKSVIN